MCTSLWFARVEDRRGGKPKASSNSRVVGHCQCHNPSHFGRRRVARRSLQSTVAASSGVVARYLEDFQTTVGSGRGDEQAARDRLVHRAESETESIRSEPHALEGSDTHSIAGISEQGNGAEVMDAIPAEVPIVFVPRATQYSVFRGSCKSGRSDSQGRVRFQGGRHAFSEVPSKCLSRPFSEGMHNVQICALRGAGSKVPKKTLEKNGSTCFRKADGQNCWQERSSPWSVGHDRRSLVPHPREVDSELLVQVASKLAVGDIPEEVIDGIRVAVDSIGKA